MTLLRNYKFPFELHDYQKDDIAHLSTLDRCGLFHSVGLGKTMISLGIALTQALNDEVDRIVIVSPPALITQWVTWLEEVSGLNNNEFEITTYRGTPAKRKEMSLKADFIVMSSDILKRDLNYLLKNLKDSRLSIIVDEAAIIRRSATKNFRAVKRISEGNKLQLLTATPLSSSPMSAYGFIKLLTPTIYRNFGQFKRLHVEKEDFWGQPVKFCNLEVMAENLMCRAIQRNAEDLIDLPEIVYKPVLYDLSAKHYNLYRKLMDEQVLVLEDEVVDATDVMRLRHIAQQLVTSPQKFTDTDITPELYHIVDETVADMGERKIVIFSNYRLTNEQVFAHVADLNPVLVYGGLTPAERDRRLNTFLTDDKCRCLVASPKSCGAGLNLQGVTNLILFTELPLTSADFIQVVGRVHRQGQKDSCIIVMAIAKNTIQEHVKRAVVDKEDVTREVYKTPQSLRKAIYGG